VREKIHPGQPCGPALAIRAELVLGLLALPWERRLALLLLSRPTLTPCGYANFTRGWWFSNASASRMVVRGGIMDSGTPHGRPCCGGPLHHRKPYEIMLAKVLEAKAWWPIDSEVWARAVELDPRARLERRKGRWHVRVVHEGNPHHWSGPTAPAVAIAAWTAQAAGLKPSPGEGRRREDRDMTDPAITLILEEIRAECERADGKCYDAAHDDQHTNPNALALAAAALSMYGEPGTPSAFIDASPEWVARVWRNWGKRRRLVIAAQFLVAEMRRLDREHANRDG
jgi:hypothetical protein